VDFLSPARRSDEPPGHQGSSIARIDNTLSPDRGKIAFLRGEKTRTHLDTVGAHHQSRSQRFTVTESARSAYQGFSSETASTTAGSRIIE